MAGRATGNCTSGYCLDAVLQAIRNFCGRLPTVLPGQNSETDGYATERNKQALNWMRA